jgi:hypothetical protein
VNIKDRLKRDSFYNSIGDILLNQWDPLGVSDTNCPKDEYETYVPVVYGLAMEIDCIEELVEHLSRIACETIGVETNLHNDKKAARLIMAIKDFNSRN